jgi:hypothetical protein
MLSFAACPRPPHDPDQLSLPHPSAACLLQGHMGITHSEPAGVLTRPLDPRTLEQLCTSILDPQFVASRVQTYGPAPVASGAEGGDPPAPVPTLGDDHLEVRCGCPLFSRLPARGVRRTALRRAPLPRGRCPLHACAV